MLGDKIMQYRNFKDFSTSLLGFGCMRFPTLEDGTIDEQKTFEMLDLALDNGVNYFDTDYPYHQGQSEIVLGKWLQTIDRDSIYVTSKMPVWKINSIEEFDKILDEQLEKLQIDHLDFYLLHALSKQRWDHVLEMGVLDHLKDVLASGKVKHIGFSFHDDYEVFEEIINAYPWDFCQIQYNYMDNNYQAGDKGYALAKKLGIPVVVMEPVRGGLLANVPDDIDKMFREYNDWSNASYALRWVMNHDNVMCVLSGMSNLEQVKDNLVTADTFMPLTDDEMKIIEKARDMFLARTKVNCTACRYCMPCPFGVNIPGNFKVYNEGNIYQKADLNKSAYLDMDESTRSTACKKCQACVTKCPQHINIPVELAKITKEYE